MKKNVILASIIILLSLPVTSAGDLKGKIKAEGEGLNDVVVSLAPIEKKNFPAPKETAIMDQKNLAFVPHVLPVLIGTKVVFPNSDQTRHSVFSRSKIKKFDFGTYPPGTEKSIICDEAGILTVLCYIHHDMSAYIVVLETPYFATTNESGEYTIHNILPGKYHLTFWHEEREIKSQDIVIPEHGTVNKNISLE
jgi:plastocyanin